MSIAITTRGLMTPDDWTFNITFSIQVNAGGTLVARFAQYSTTVNAATFLKGSTIQAVEIPT